MNGWRLRGSGAKQEPIPANAMAVEAAVKDEIDARLGRYIAAGAATVATNRSAPDVGCDFEILPKATGAAAVYLSVSANEVTAGVGNGVVDFFLDERGQWRRDLGELLEAVADGRYEEAITEGRFFERTVQMRFPGTRLGGARYSNLSYDGNDPEDLPPAIGDRQYRAWLPGLAN